MTGTLYRSTCTLQWEDAADEEEDWETAEADVPMTVSGVTGSFDVEASEAAGQSP